MLKKENRYFVTNKRYKLMTRQKQTWNLSKTFEKTIAHESPMKSKAISYMTKTTSYLILFYLFTVVNAVEIALYRFF